MTPTIDEVKDYFKNAQSIIGLTCGKNIDKQYWTEIGVHEHLNSYWINYVNHPKYGKNSIKIWDSYSKQYAAFTPKKATIPEYEKYINQYDGMKIIAVIGQIYRNTKNELYHNGVCVGCCSHDIHTRGKWLVPSTKEEYEAQFITQSKPTILPNCCIKKKNVKDLIYPDVVHITCEGDFKKISDITGLPMTSYREEQRYYLFSTNKSLSGTSNTRDTYEGMATDSRYVIYEMSDLIFPEVTSSWLPKVGEYAIMETAGGYGYSPRNNGKLALIESVSAWLEFGTKVPSISGKVINPVDTPHNFTDIPIFGRKDMGVVCRKATQSEIDAVMGVKVEEPPKYIRALINYPNRGAVKKGEIGVMVRVGLYDFPSQKNYSVSTLPCPSRYEVVSEPKESTPEYPEYYEFVVSSSSNFTKGKIYKIIDKFNIESEGNFIGDDGRANGFSGRNSENFKPLTYEKYQVQEEKPTPKFKVGDWVIGLPSIGNEYYITKENTIWEVKSIYGTNIEVWNKFNEFDKGPFTVNSKYFALTDQRPDNIQTEIFMEPDTSGEYEKSSSMGMGVCLLGSACGTGPSYQTRKPKVDLIPLMPIKRRIII